MLFCTLPLLLSVLLFIVALGTVDHQEGLKAWKFEGVTDVIILGIWTILKGAKLHKFYRFLCPLFLFLNSVIVIISFWSNERKSASDLN